MAEFAVRKSRGLGPVLRLAALLLAALLPCACFGWPAAVAELLLAWPVAAALQVSWGFEMALLPLMVAGAAMATCPAIPAWLMMVWGVLGTCGVLVRLRSQQANAAWWTGLCLAALMAAAAALHQASGAQLPAIYLAQRLIELIDQSPKGTEILLNAYQMGLASLEGKLAMLPALRLGSVVVMTPEVRMELLYGLRTSLEELLYAMLPKAGTMWALLTALACAVIPGMRRRRQGLPREEKAWLPWREAVQTNKAAEAVLQRTRFAPVYPPMEEWHMPRMMGLGAACLYLCGLMPYAQAPAMHDLLVMLGNVGSLMFMVQGASLMLFLMRRMDMQRSMRGTWTLVAAVLLPQLMVLMGFADQVLPLRGPKDDSNEMEDQ